MITITLCSPRELAFHDQLQDWSATPPRVSEDAGLHRLSVTLPAGVPLREARAAAARWREPEVAVAVLTGDLAAYGPGLIVSDVDSTLITAEVIELLAEHAGTRAEVAAVTDRAMRGEIDFAESLRRRVATLAGLPVEVFARVSDRVELSPGAQRLADRARRRGCALALVSGGFHEIVDRVAAPLGDVRIRANRLEVAGGVLTGRTVGPVIDGAAKAVALREFAAELGVPPGRTVAVGDGANDLAMLAEAGLGVAYRAKPVLVEAADCAVPFPRLDAVADLTGL